MTNTTTAQEFDITCVNHPQREAVEMNSNGEAFCDRCWNSDDLDFDGDNIIENYNESDFYARYFDDHGREKPVPEMSHGRQRYGWGDLGEDEPERLVYGAGYGGGDGSTENPASDWNGLSNDPMVGYPIDVPNAPSHTPDRYYFAYGSNLHVPQMLKRCPDSKPAFRLHLDDWWLVFKGVADIEPHTGGKVHGAVYLVSEADEQKLDSYEGFPTNYSKRFFNVEFDGKQVEVMFYKMNRGGTGVPSKGYFDCLADGFVHWGLNKNRLFGALDRAADMRTQHNLKPKNKGRWFKLPGSKGELTSPTSGRKRYETIEIEGFNAPSLK